MENANRIRTLRRKQGHQNGRFALISNQLDEYEQLRMQDRAALTLYEGQLDTAWNKFNAIQDELDELDAEEHACVDEKYIQYFNLKLRITHLLETALPTTPLNPASRDSDNVAEPISVKLPEIHLPTFDGSIENWHSFYDSFTSRIDRNERLTPGQKLHYLRLALTGRAARSIQSLDVTDHNYSVAIDVLKEKFDYHRQVCMRHWDLIVNYPRITKESPEAVDDLLETVKVNLQALEKLDEPVASNVVLIALLTSKLPSDIICEWQLTLPDKKMPSYAHLLDFLKTRTNGDRINITSTTTKKEHEFKTSEQRYRVRQNASHGHTFGTTLSPPTCPICRRPERSGDARSSE
jgi:hypothetical protein